jgi:adenylate kinase
VAQKEGSEVKTQIIFLGAPGSGKGTQALLLSEKLGYKHLSTGDLLRAEVARASQLGNRIAGIIHGGNLVDDATVVELLTKNCDTALENCIFDGFPRNYQQALILEEKLLNGLKFHAVFFEVDVNKLVERLTNRRTCSTCKNVYNLISAPPKKSGICDKCVTPTLMRRADDDEAVIRQRMNVYNQTIGPVLEHYRRKGILLTVNATQKAESVFEDLQRALKACV